MYRKRTLGEFLAGLFLAAALVTVAYAANHDEMRELSALQNAKITLIDAIKTAEQHNSHDVMIVDRMLPGLDGLGLVRALRESGVKVPVLS